MDRQVFEKKKIKNFYPEYEGYSIYANMRVKGYTQIRGLKLYSNTRVKIYTLIFEKK